MSPRARRATSADGALLEEPWQRQVIELATINGWRYYHAPDNRPLKGSGRRQAVVSGFPDLVLIRGPELLFVELKTDKGTASPMQKAWLEAIEVVEKAVAEMNDELNAQGYGTAGLVDNVPACIEAHLWRPRDWDAVQARLARDWGY